MGRLRVQGRSMVAAGSDRRPTIASMPKTAIRSRPACPHRPRSRSRAGWPTRRPRARRLAPTAVLAVLWRQSRKRLSREVWMYQAPKLERLGTFREVTLAGGDFNPGDGGNPYHRYAPIG